MYACVDILVRWHRSRALCQSERVSAASWDPAACACWGQLYASAPRVVTGDVRSSPHRATAALVCRRTGRLHIAACLAWSQVASRACCHVNLRTRRRGFVLSSSHSHAPRLCTCGKARDRHHLSSISTLIEPLHARKAVVPARPQSGFGMRIQHHQRPTGI